MPETDESEQLKLSVLKRIGSGINPNRTMGPSNYCVGDTKIHARFCRTNNRSPHLFKFNINPNTLASNYELWICGHVELYYLIPTSLMQRIYDDPDAYPDNRNPEIRVVSVDVSTNKITYKTGGGKLDIAEYRNKRL